MEEVVTQPARTITVDYTGACLAVSFVLLGLLVVALVVIIMRGQRGNTPE